MKIFRFLPDKPQPLNQLGPSLIIVSPDFKYLESLWKRQTKLKLFLDQIKEEFIDAHQILLLPLQNLNIQEDHQDITYSGQFALIIEYKVDDEDRKDLLVKRLHDINLSRLTQEQLRHLCRESIEILLNLSSYNADFKVLNPDCFLLVKNKDVKLDLFYLSIFEDFKIEMSLDNDDHNEQVDQESIAREIQKQDGIKLNDLKQTYDSIKLIGMSKRYMFPGIDKLIQDKNLNKENDLSDKYRVYSLGVIIKEMNEKLKDQEVSNLSKDFMLTIQNQGSLDLMEHSLLQRDLDQSEFTMDFKYTIKKEDIHQFMHLMCIY
ncbi:UNKNOWN [Stylonychia lemnae]|uniref:Uncharacterized protein n=1 Tax=Stylonychia lemnae TaxID=5949 RepID=A0A077ZYK3_STYLE|nr:UNKNOWN [Stylonychia lemnae]|eukprot:CDW75021.1 UNKNOWN [Stylonychia lemnae]